MVSASLTNPPERAGTPDLARPTDWLDVPRSQPGSGDTGAAKGSDAGRRPPSGKPTVR